MSIKDLQLKAIGPDLAAVLPNDDTPWYKKPHLLRLNFCLFCLFLFSSANGYDGSMMNGLQALPQWHKFMQSPTGAWLGFVNAVQSLGALVCYPAVAWSNNRFGRKKSIAVGYFWIVLGTALQTAAQSPTMFVLGRLFIGGASAFFGISAAVLITETAYPTHRATFTALSNCGWYIGSLLAAWVTYGSRNYASDGAWRIPSLLQVAVPLVAFSGFCITPESPRWLTSMKRFDETRSFLIKYHAGGDESSALAEFEFQEITKTIALEAEIAKTASYLDMIRTEGNRHRSFISVTLGIFSQWNGVGVVSYYLAPVLQTVGVTSVTHQTLISGFLQVWNLVIAVGAAFSVDYVGRRKLFMTSCLGMLVSFTVVSALSGSFATTGVAATGVAVVPFLFLFSGFFDIAFTPLLFSYLCEIWPYNLRARGVSLGLSATQLAVFFNIFVNPIALEAIQWKYYIVYCVILVIITLTIWFCYPETIGHSLEEMCEIFDNANAVVPGQLSMQDSIAKGRHSTEESKEVQVEQVV
ncbi:general substrate transporter [Halenospora varia]|nr:general substrate transporter [Halenospora varia]